MIEWYGQCCMAFPVDFSNTRRSSGMEGPKLLHVAYAVIKIAAYLINAVWILTRLVNDVILALRASEDGTADLTNK
jgi:hypothetical protein